jgi:hypothetical protein
MLLLVGEARLAGTEAQSTLRGTARTEPNTRLVFQQNRPLFGCKLLAFLKVDPILRVVSCHSIPRSVYSALCLRSVWIGWPDKLFVTNHLQSSLLCFVSRENSIIALPSVSRR